MLRIYEVQITKSGETLEFNYPDDMKWFMKEENDFESLENITNPIQFNIQRDIQSIKNMKPGATWRHALATIKCFEA